MDDNSDDEGQAGDANEEEDMAVPKVITDDFFLEVCNATNAVRYWAQISGCLICILIKIILVRLRTDYKDAARGATVQSSRGFPENVTGQPEFAWFLARRTAQKRTNER